MYQTWKEVATSHGISIDAQKNTTIIIDDIFSWAPTFELVVKYLECQLQVCQSQNLSLLLKKSLFFLSRIEFVGHDVCENGNRPAQSKNNLLKTWPKFRVVRDIHIFVGFILFYAAYIPNAELRMFKLRELMKLPYEGSMALLATAEHYTKQNDMLQVLLADPCIARFDPEIRCYLTTNFSAIGFAYILCQPGSDINSCGTMRCEIAADPASSCNPNPT